jgi:hypothetical protein
VKRKDDPEELQEQDLRTEDMRLCALHHKWLKELFIVIRGNGDPKHGMQWKVQKLLDNQAIISKLMWIITIAILGRLIASPIWSHVASHFFTKG